MHSLSSRSANSRGKCSFKATRGGVQLEGPRFVPVVRMVADGGDWGEAGRRDTPGVAVSTMRALLIPYHCGCYLHIARRWSGRVVTRALLMEVIRRAGYRRCETGTGVVTNIWAFRLRAHKIVGSDFEQPTAGPAKVKGRVRGII